MLGLVLNAWRAWLQHSTRCSLDGRGPHRVPPSGAGRSTVHIACARCTAAGRVRQSCCGSYHPDRQAGHTAWAPRPVRWRPRLNASGQLLIPGRRSEPGVFPRHLRVPPVRPAKHHPHHYRRGKPSGQADQHPPPQAHPNPKRHIPKSRTRAVPSTHHTTSHASTLRPSPLSPSPLWRNHAHGSWATSPAAISAFLKLTRLAHQPSPASRRHHAPTSNVGLIAVQPLAHGTGIGATRVCGCGALHHPVQRTWPAVAVGL